MPAEHQQILAGIAALEAQRVLLGDAVVDASIVGLRSKLVELTTAPAAEPTQTLRQVSILFLDVVGSTTLSQYLDPEDIHAVMDGALARCTSVVLAHHGKVLQYAGDNLLAAFGADEAREDDPERAVRCGLALLAQGRALGEEVQRTYDHAGFDVRVGIHTGGVLLGGGVDAEGTIRGIAVNIAARMEQTSPAGAVRISHDTYAQVRGIFDVEPQDPIDVKGVDAPIRSYLVQRAKPRAFRIANRGIEGVATRMIGRDAELEVLQDAFKRLFAERKLAAVTVVAEAGIGKSRLLYEFLKWAEARAESFRIFQGRAHSTTQTQPYGLLRDILAGWLQIADIDSMQAAKDKVEQGIAPLFARDEGSDLAQAHAHLLGHLIGLDFAESKHIEGIRDDAEQIRRHAFHTAAQMFRRVAAEAGTAIVLLLDDLHWADDGSLDFLTYLADVSRDVPMLVVGLTRPTLFERRADWGSAEGIHMRIDMPPLDRDASRLLAHELLKKLPEIPAALHELITGSAEGNPFYMEELIKMLVDEGTIKISADHWSVITDQLLSTRVPQTLTGVLQARLDSLKPSEKLALQQASVIGAVFWDQALAAIDAKATEALPGVTRRELVVPHQDTSVDGAREYAFKHQILHHVTYDTVLKRLRRGYHAKVAEWLAALTSARANDFLGVTAEHFEQGGNNQRACEYFTRAAVHAAARYAHGAVMDYVTRALALAAGNDHATRWRLHDLRERALDLQGRRAEQQAEIGALEELADLLDDDGRRGEVAWRRSDIALRTADYRAAEGAARQAMALAARAGDAELGLRAQHRLAGALCRLDDVAGGKTLAQDGLAAARLQGLRDAEARFLNTLCFAAAGKDDPLATLAIGQQWLLIERERGDRRAEADAFISLGALWLALGERIQARRHYEEGLRLTRAVGDRASEPYALNGLSMLALWQGDVDQALVHARSALDIAMAVQDPAIEAGALCCLGDAELALERHGAAAAAFKRAHAVALAHGRVCSWQDAAAGLARVAMARGDAAQALRQVEGVLAHLAAGGRLEGREAQLTRLTCHQVLARTGDPRAAELLASAHAELQARAATLTDATLRQGFLNNIPEHREIVAAWAALERKSGAASDAE